MSNIGSSVSVQKPPSVSKITHISWPVTHSSTSVIFARVIIHQPKYHTFLRTTHPSNSSLISAFRMLSSCVDHQNYVRWPSNHRTMATRTIQHHLWSEAIKQQSYPSASRMLWTRVTSAVTETRTNGSQRQATIISISLPNVVNLCSLSAGTEKKRINGSQ
jgi:hypothetical protein